MKVVVENNVQTFEKHECVCVCEWSGKPEEHLENRHGTLERSHAQLHHRTCLKLSPLAFPCIWL